MAKPKIAKCWIKVKGTLKIGATITASGHQAVLAISLRSYDDGIKVDYGSTTVWVGTHLEISPDLYLEVEGIYKKNGHVHLLGSISEIVSVHYDSEIYNVETWIEVVTGETLIRCLSTTQ